MHKLEDGRRWEEKHFSLSFITSYTSVINAFSINTLFLQTYRESIHRTSNHGSIHLPPTIHSPSRIDSYFWIVLYIHSVQGIFSRERNTYVFPWHMLTRTWSQTHIEPYRDAAGGIPEAAARLQWRTCSTSSWSKARRANDRRLTLYTFTVDLWPREACIRLNIGLVVENIW